MPPHDPRNLTLQAGELPSGLTPAPGSATLSAARSATQSSGASSEEMSRHTLGVADVEGMLAAGEHERVCDLLGPPDRAAALPAPLALVYIAARGEIGQGADLSDLPHLAVNTSGALLAVDPSSHAARLVAKALLGLNPAALARRAPKAPPRLGLLAAALVVGLVVGLAVGAML
jgi:hypothetical protein